MSAGDDLTPSLVAQLRAGSGEAGVLLDRLYRDAMTRLAWGYLGDLDDAEDAAQEIFCKVLEADRVPERFARFACWSWRTPPKTSNCDVRCFGAWW